MTAPTVSVVVPARNEERDIRSCLEALLAQDHPHDRMEIILVDGGSTDRTVDLATQILRSSDVPWRIVENAQATTPSNLNVGLAAASGEILCRVDARSVVSSGHVRRCAELLLEEAPDRAVVGGGQRAVPRPGASVVARAIARALNNRWATGLATYRRSMEPGPADTVYLGAFRVRDLHAVGGWAAELPTNQDFDLNQRLGGADAVWFDPSLTACYLPRESLSELAQQYFRFGRWKRRYWRLRSAQPTSRQVVLLAIPPVLVAVAVVALAKRPALAAAGLAASMFAVEVTGAEEAAPAAERALSLVAVGVIGGCWWAGVGWEVICD